MPAQGRGDLGQPGGVRADRRQPDPGIGDHLAVHPDRGTGRHDRPVSGPSLDLLVGARAVRAQRDAHLGQHLGVTDGRLVRAAVELLHRHDPLAGGAADHAARVQRRADRGEILGRVGLAQRSAERAAVADDRVGDDPLGVAEDRERRGQLVGLEQLPMAGHGADPDLGRLDGDVAQLVVQVVDVDQVLEVGQPQLHHRQQAVTARHEPGRVTEAVQQPDGLIHAGRALVLERCRNLHA